MESFVSRSEVTQACLIIMPSMKDLVPQYVNEVTLWHNCATKCFIDNIQTKEAETLRVGLQLLEKQGYLK